MANSGHALIGRIAALMFFLSLGAGLYALNAHGDLESAEAKLASITQERDRLKNELVGTEKTVLASSSELQSCTRELKAAKSAQNSQVAPASKGKAL